MVSNRCALRLLPIEQISTLDDLVRAFGRDGIDGTISPISSNVGINRADPDQYVLNVGIGGPWPTGPGLLLAGQ